MLSNRTIPSWVFETDCKNHLGCIIQASKAAMRSINRAFRQHDHETVGLLHRAEDTLFSEYLRLMQIQNAESTARADLTRPSADPRPLPVIP